MGVICFQKLIFIIVFFIYFDFNLCVAQNFSITGHSCETKFDCLDENRICYNNECKCGPNYSWNSNHSKCEYFNCSYDSDCQEFDSNQVCSFNESCICGNGFTRNKTTNICQNIQNIKNNTIVNNTLNSYCNKSSDCQKYGDLNQICFNNYCECKSNYRWNESQVCEHINCMSDSDCESYGENWFCSNNQCICAENYYTPKNTLCLYNSTIAESNTSTTLSPIEKYCFDISYCGTNQFCVNHKCECQPGFVYTVVYDTCWPIRCTDSSDCNKYDPKRECYFGDCKCISGYVIDPKTKICNNTVETSCNSISDCGSNQFCINKLCECQPNYYYDYNWSSCRIKSCYKDSDCNMFDKNSICVANDCICKSGYKIDPKTKICNLTVEKLCYSISDCGSNQFCVKNICECQPNYKFNSELNKCVISNNCYYDSDCNQFDTKRVCLNRQCNSCQSYYAIDPKTQLCNKTIGIFCNSNYDCTKYGDNNQVCVDNSCQCKPDYRIDSSANYCHYHGCNFDSDCNSYDKHRICDEFSCNCDYNYKADPNNFKCQYYNGLYWIWTLLVIPVIFILICLVRIRNRRSSSQTRSVTLQQSNTTINSTAPMISSNQYSTNNSHYITNYDPPPPYSQ